MTAGPGNGDGIQLQVAETADHPLRRFPGPLSPTGGAARQSGPVGFEEPGPDQGQPAGQADAQTGCHGSARVSTSPGRLSIRSRTSSPSFSVLTR